VQSFVHTEALKMLKVIYNWLHTCCHLHPLLQNRCF